MNKKASQFGLLMLICLMLSSCAGLRYSDQGRPLDFLHAKRYKAAKKELVEKDSEKQEIAESKMEEPVSKKGITDINETNQVDLPLWGYVLLAIFIPPLAVGLYEGITGRFWLDLILLILASGYTYVSILGLFGIAAVALALLIVLDVI